jgi:hypothetical protein
VWEGLVLGAGRGLSIAGLEDGGSRREGRERGRGEGGRNDPNIVCTYKLKKKKDYSVLKINGL